jgi:lipoprotein-anchoring transpeptidase ErfK/SrfK
VKKVTGIDDITRRTGELRRYHTNRGKLLGDATANDPENAADAVDEAPAAPTVKTPVVPAPAPSSTAADTSSAVPVTSPAGVDCTFDATLKAHYDGELMAEEKMYSADPETYVRTRITVRNKSNVPWFSDASGCGNGATTVMLGTSRERDHASRMYVSYKDSGWISNNRISLTTPRVNPGETGVFEFVAFVPETPDVYREYFTVVIPGVQWIDKSEISVDYLVGEPYDQSTLMKKINYLNDSSAGSVIDFDAPRSFEVDLSDQTTTVKLGDYAVRRFLISSGAKKHPTPVGNYKILFKQQWRIGAADPYYIMPKFMAFRPDGYGFHGLPSLSNRELRARIRALGNDTPIPVEWLASDVMWTEALDHLGSPRSHGCVRYGPNDIDFVFDFAEVGTPVIVRG